MNLQLCSERKILPDDALASLGIDEGQESLKIVVNIVDKNKHINYKKRRYNKAFPNYNGVKKTQLLAVGFGMKESTESLKYLWDKCDLGTALSNFPGEKLIAADYKCINLMCGLSGNQSTYPCPFCTAFVYKRGKSDVHTIICSTILMF